MNLAYTWDADGRLVGINDHQSGGMMTMADYTATGHPATVTQPTGVRASYGYDGLDRLAMLEWSDSRGRTFVTYGYELTPTGQHRAVAEATGRRVEYGYDAARRLTHEAITGAPPPLSNGSVTYLLDAFGNRLQRISTMSGIADATATYDANDRLVRDAYDANGNTTWRAGTAFSYDYADRLVGKAGGEVTLTYDGDGAVVAKTVAGVTTRYLVDDLNPTGYSQVVESSSAASCSGSTTGARR